MHLLTAIILVPFITAVIIALIPREVRFGIRLLALASGALTLFLSLILFLTYDSSVAVNGYHFVHKLRWVPSMGISYHVGVDGINLGLIVMGAIVAFAAICASWEIKTREKDFYVLLMIMIGGILGAFASLDLFFFYFFHELALVPTFIMIGVWGTGEDKNYATFQITLYLSLGALIALFGLIALYVQSGAHSFDIVTLTAAVRRHPISLAAQNFIFPLLMFGFGILVSLWPFHTWAPTGYGAAPTPTSMLHAGVLKKFGLYGLIRVALPLLPDGAQNWLPILAFLCLGNIFYCGLVAMRQKQLSLLIGNSSVAHMGFVFLGIASLSIVGMTGAVLVMVAHGLLAALSFGLHGYLYQHLQTSQMDRMGGLLRRMPFIGTALMMAMLAGCGLPGFGNFAGEVLVLFGAWKSYTLVTVLAAWGALIIGAVYMLRAGRTILYGPLPEKWNAVPDAGPWRKLPFATLLGTLLLLGFWPRLLTDKMEPDVTQVVRFATHYVEPPQAKKFQVTIPASRRAQATKAGVPVKK
jgi:NADH-quinone oxidoreductase subunit M